MFSFFTVSLASGGSRDIMIHAKRDSHKNSKRSVTNTTHASDFYTSSRKDIWSALVAEVQIAMTLVQHNTFFNITDHLTPISTTVLQIARQIRHILHVEANGLKGCHSPYIRCQLRANNDEVFRY